jgi:membrane protein implicated in regulation of membrane protease activity
MTFVIGAFIVVGLCMLGKNILLAIGHLFWAACAALAGAVIGALFSQVIVGAAIGVACYVWLLVSLAANHRRAVAAAAQQQEAMMRYQAQLNAEAMVEAAQRVRPQARLD